MKCIVVDLELNQPSNKIIQIGAVCVDLRACRVVSTYNVYVNPGELLNPEITELTGITQELVDTGASLGNALEFFWLYVRTNQTNLVGAWGTDIKYLVGSSREIGVEIPSKLRELDIKSMFQVIRCGFPASKSQGGLLATLNLVGLDFRGRQHNALDDAYNTARLLIYARELQYIYNQKHTRRDLEGSTYELARQVPGKSEASTSSTN